MEIGHRCRSLRLVGRTLLVRLLVTSALAVPASPASSETLHVEPVSKLECRGYDLVVPGQKAIVTGSQFLPGIPVQLNFAFHDAARRPIGTATSDAGGRLRAEVLIPAAPFAPIDVNRPGLLEAVSREPLQWAVTTVVVVSSLPAPDSDRDRVPDFCDVCPELSNPGQEDEDQDGRGDPCDPCPRAAEDDVDGDGLCEGGVDDCSYDPDNDIDQDQVCGDFDNCPSISNRWQEDDDANGIGDACQTHASCSDGADNDLDGRADHPDDPGCADGNDPTEEDPNQICDDGKDNDADGLTDWHSSPRVGDPGCGTSISRDSIENPECDDGKDNDGDGKIDFDGRNGAGEPDPDCLESGTGQSESSGEQ